MIYTFTTTEKRAPKGAPNSPRMGILEEIGKEGYLTMATLADEGKSLSACETSDGGDFDFDSESPELNDLVVSRSYSEIGYGVGISLANPLHDDGEEPVSDDPVRDSISRIFRELKELRARLVDSETREKEMKEEVAELRATVADQERQIGLLKAKAFRLDEENHQLRGWLEALDSEFDERMDRAGKVLGFLLGYAHWYDKAAMDDFKMGARIDILRFSDPELCERYTELKNRGTKDAMEELRAIERELTGFPDGVDILGDLGGDPAMWRWWWSLDDSQAERMDAVETAKAAVERVMRRPKPSQVTEERIDSLLKTLGVPELRRSPCLAFRAAREKLGITEDQMKKLTPHLKESEWFDIWDSESGNSRPYGVGGARKKMIGLSDAGVDEAERRIRGRSQ